MHRKRVTCELHDSHFRLIPIKHAIPKIEWAIEWALNYYITQSRQEVGQLEFEKRACRESHTRPKGSLARRWSFGDQLVIRYSKEYQHSAESWAPGLLVEHQENQKDTRLTAIRLGVNILQFCSVSSSLSHANVTNKVRRFRGSRKLISSLLCVGCIGHRLLTSKSSGLIDERF